MTSDGRRLVDAVGSGDGFVTVADGTRRWGRFGAAGLLARHHDDGGTPWYFLARRSLHCHQGGTWAMPGGAIDRHETPLVGAVREFTEEIGDVLGAFEVAVVHEDDHGGWSYWTHVVDVAERFDAPTVLTWETDEARWVPGHQLHELELLAPFRHTLVRLGLLPAAG